MRTPTTIACAWFACSLVGLSACGPEPVFPVGWAESYREVRACRRSGDHDLNYVRILADEAAFGPYQLRDAGFPEGAVVLKVEHADSRCQSVTGFTAMKRLRSGGDWHWQRLDAQRSVQDDGQVVRCVSCHQACGRPPGGFEGTCAEP